MKKKVIPDSLYKKIVGLVPICCVDLVIKKGNSFLLVKRLENPAKGKWWFAGGRVLFNETLLTAAKRKLSQEVGIDDKKVLDIQPLGVKEIRFKTGRYGQPVYSIIHVFLVELPAKGSFDVRMDKTMSDYRWFEKALGSFDTHIKEFLRKAGCK